MELRDYHTHHKRCHHAEGDIIDYIKSAIEKGLTEIGISDHFPMKNLLPGITCTNDTLKVQKKQLPKKDEVDSESEKKN